MKFTFWNFCLIIFNLGIGRAHVTPLSLSNIIFRLRFSDTLSFRQFHLKFDYAHCSQGWYADWPNLRFSWMKSNLLFFFFFFWICCLVAYDRGDSFIHTMLITAFHFSIFDSKITWSLVKRLAPEPTDSYAKFNNPLNDYLFQSMTWLSFKSRPKKIFSWNLNHQLQILIMVRNYTIKATNCSLCLKMQKNMMNGDVKNSRNGVMKAFYKVTVDFPTSSELELPEFWQNILKLPIHT